MAFPGRGTRRTSNPLLLIIAGLLALSAHWTLPMFDASLQPNRIVTGVFVAFALLAFWLAVESYRARAARPAA